MNAEIGVLLRSMSPGCSKEKGKGYDNMIGYAVVVSISTSCSRCYNLALSSHFPHVVLTHMPHGLYIGFPFHTSIYSIDTTLYPYALPLIYFS